MNIHFLAFGVNIGVEHLIPVFVLVVVLPMAVGVLISKKIKSVQDRNNQSAIDAIKGSRLIKALLLVSFCIIGLFVFFMNYSIGDFIQ